MNRVAAKLKEYADLFFSEDEDVFVVEEEVMENGLAYLESMPRIGGGSSEEKEKNLDFDKIGGYVRGDREKKYVTVGEEFRKTGSCNQTALALRGRITNDLFLSFLKCWRWICPDCGSDEGRIHNKRIHRVLSRVEALMGGFAFNLRQTVFTVPLEVRQYFMSPKALTSLCRMAVKINKAVVSDSPSIRYLHCMGDKKHGVFNPHVNIHAFEEDGVYLKLSLDEIKELRHRWGLALQGYIRAVFGVHVDWSVFEKVDVNYSFVEGKREYKTRRGVVPGVALILHRIKYMCRLHPGFADLDGMKDNEEMLRLFICEMKGFAYITNCGSWKVKDCDRKEEWKEMESLAGEPLKVERDKDGKILYYSRSEVDLKWRPKELIELSDGFYRVKEMVREKKKKKGKK